MATPKLQTRDIASLCWKVSITTGVASSGSTTVTGIAAEDVVLEVIELTGAGAGAVTGHINRTSAVTGQGANWLQFNVDCDGDWLEVRYHDKTA